MSCHGSRASFLQCSTALNSDDEINNFSEKQLSKCIQQEKTWAPTTLLENHIITCLGLYIDEKTARDRRPYTPLPSRPASSLASSIPNAFRRSIFRKRPVSMGESPRRALRFNSAEISRMFDFGRTGRARSASISSGYGLLQNPEGIASHESNDVFRDDACYADGSSKPIMSFRGGVSWRNLDKEREELSLDLFWSDTRRENPFRPDIMPIEDLRPLSNFRNLRFLKLTGMLQSYQPFIWQAVWLNPALEDLHLEMALEPCIRQAFAASWPKIRGSWFPRTAPTARGLY